MPVEENAYDPDHEESKRQYIDTHLFLIRSFELLIRICKLDGVNIFVNDNHLVV
jgi:hypothetical protein